MAKGHVLDQPLLLLDPLPVFLLRIDIGIIVKYRDGKIIGEILQHIAAARRAAAMKKQAGDLPLVPLPFNHGVQFFLIVSLVHKALLTFSFDTLFPADESGNTGPWRWRIR